VLQLPTGKITAQAGWQDLKTIEIGNWLFGHLLFTNYPSAKLRLGVLWKEKIVF